VKTRLLAFFMISLTVYSCTNYPSQPISTPTPIRTPLLSPIPIPSIIVTPTPSTLSTPQISASSSVVIQNSSSSPTPTSLISVEPKISPTPVFIPLPKTNNILFDTSVRPFKENSVNNISGLSKLTDILIKEKYNVLFDNFNNQDLDIIDTIIIVSPYLNYSEQDIEKLQKFLSQGKKIFILGEWGGYGGFNATGINKLLEIANLRINEDVLKESQSINYDFSDEQVLIKDFLKHPLTLGISVLSFYSTATIDIIDINKNNALILGQSSISSFKVMANSKSGVVGASEYQNGKIIVLGDSSILLDNDTNSNSISNIDESDNTKFILNILKW
jgi:hypothetical protein